MLMTMAPKFAKIVLLLTLQSVLGSDSDRMLLPNATDATHQGNIVGIVPTVAPTESPAPSPSPSAVPTVSPTPKPSTSPTKAPTVPSDSPTESPAPSPSPSQTPTMLPTRSPTTSPSASPSVSEKPSFHPSTSPTEIPTLSPTQSQRPSSIMQPYAANGLEIVFENVLDMFEMDQNDISLFESTTKKMLQKQLSSPDINEILVLKVEVKDQKMVPTRRGVRRYLKSADLAISFDVTALINRDWKRPFDLKEIMMSYFGKEETVEKLRSQLELAGATFLKETAASTDDGTSVAVGSIVGAIVGVLVIVAGVVFAYRRCNTSFQSKISLASTGSDDEEDESSDAQMIVAGQNLYSGNILSFPTPTGGNEGVEANFFGSSRPAFLTMDSNIEVPDTPVGFTPQGSKHGVASMDTPNSMLGPQNTSTRSVGFRQFLMDTPPSAMHATNKSSRGFFRPPRTATSQQNTTPRKQTIDNVSPAGNKSTIVDSDKLDSSPITFPSDFGSGAKADQKLKLKPSARDTNRVTSKLRIRKWSSGYFSDESTP